MLADELMVLLNELTQLSKMENSKVALRARQVACPSSTSVCFKCLQKTGYLKMDTL